MNAIDCSVIILSFNTKQITKKCLDFLKAAVDLATQSHIRVEVIVLDNSSMDGSAGEIKRNYSWVRLIESKINTGFARGNNLAMKKARGKYLLLLNSDAYVGKDALVDCFDYIKANPQVDLFGCRLLNKDGSLQPSAGYLPGPMNTCFWLLGLDVFSPIHPKSSAFFSSEREVGWVMGAFMFMKRKVYEKTNGFDENIFMYMEEVEWCKRIKDLGFNIRYIPAFSILHLGQASGNNKKSLQLELEVLPYYFAKHYPKWAWLIPLLIKTGAFLRWLAFSTLGQPRRGQIYWQILTGK